LSEFLVAFSVLGLSSRERADVLLIRRFRVKHFVLAGLLGASVCPLHLGIYELSKGVMVELFWFLPSNPEIARPVWKWIFLLAIFPPIFEELLFRGYIMGVMRMFLHSRMVPVIISAFLFGLSHDPKNVFGATIAGLLCGIIATETMSLFPAMAFHSALNLSVLLIEIVGDTELGRSTVVSIQDHSYWSLALSFVVSVACLWRIFATSCIENKGDNKIRLG
jgi:membrane protease YdiL (CAAX protease family)